jgi:dihydrolipoamide dehydrogenase
MPSKVALHLAETYSHRSHFAKLGIKGSEQIRLDGLEALEHIRDLRDMFVDLILANTTDDMGDKLIEGYAEFLDPFTMQLDGLPIYIAGDATGGRGTLQSATDQGRVAGFNAARRSAVPFRPKTHVSIVFCDPNIASVGTSWSSLEPDACVVGEVRFGPVGRAVISGRNRGVLRIYADKNSKRILGAAMIGARCEHLAHLLAWAVEQGMTVRDALCMPYYHPVFEEAIQDALYELDRRLDGPAAGLVHLRRLDGWTDDTSADRPVVAAELHEQ